MLSLTEYRLRFCSGFHLGRRGVTPEEAQATLPADTLYAALLATYRRLGGRPDALARGFPRLYADGNQATGSPPFLLTSAYPFVGDLRFFPLPVPLSRFLSERILTERRKVIGGIRFVSEGIFRLMTDGKLLDGYLFPDESTDGESELGTALQGGAFWMMVKERAKLPPQMHLHPRTKRELPHRALLRQQVFSSDQVPHVTVDRISSTPNIHHTGRVSYRRGCGLWFGVDWREPGAQLDGQESSLQSGFERILAFLGEQGIGGKRSIGYGTFNYYRPESRIELPEPSPGGQALLLSRYHPREDELPDTLTRAVGYELVPLAGWLQTFDAPTQGRRRVWLVREGSMVRATGGQTQGELVDIGPVYDGGPALPHPVWRYGVALAVGVKEVSDA